MYLLAQFYLTLYLRLCVTSEYKTHFMLGTPSGPAWVEMVLPKAVLLNLVCAAGRADAHIRWLTFSLREQRFFAVTSHSKLALHESEFAA